MTKSAANPNNSADTPLRAQLRTAGLRVTDVRLSVMRALGASRVALDANAVADQLVKAGEEPDRVTVYRTLNTLVDSGIAHRIDPGDRIFRYSLTDHAHCTPEHHEHEHPHMMCDKCGAVECIEDAEVVIRPKSGKAAGGGGTAKPTRKFRITQQSVLLHGVCERCGDQ